MKDELKSLEKHLGQFDFNSRIPFYNDSSDYTTNAPSYYDDLARKNKLIKHLALRIWDYDKEMLKRLAEWDKNLEEFDDEVLRLLKEWMADGTFEEIINEVIFGKLNDKVDNVTDRVNVNEGNIVNINNNVKTLGYYVSDYPIQTPEIDDTKRLQRAIDDVNSKDGGRLFFGETLNLSDTIYIKENVYLDGQSKYKSKLFFTDMCDGIMTQGRVDNFGLENFTIEGEENYYGTIGIHITGYSGYFLINNVDVRNFGQWGIKLDGGIQWTVENINAWFTGRNPNDNNKNGTIFVDVGRNDSTLRSVGATIRNVYARGGGKYALYLYRPTDLEVTNYIAEYHEYALYAHNSSGIVKNFYQEANTSTDESIHVHDSGGLMFFGGTRVFNERFGGGVKYTWSGVSFSDRHNTNITSSNITTNEVITSKLNLNGRTHLDGSDGDIRYNNTNGKLELFNNGLWGKIDNSIWLQRGVDTDARFILNSDSSYSVFKLYIAVIGETDQNFKYQTLLCWRNGYMDDYLTKTIEEHLADDPAVILPNVTLTKEEDQFIVNVTPFGQGTMRVGVRVENLVGENYILQEGE